MRSPYQPPIYVVASGTMGFEAPISVFMLCTPYPTTMAYEL